MPVLFFFLSSAHLKRHSKRIKKPDLKFGLLLELTAVQLNRTSLPPSGFLCFPPDFALWNKHWAAQDIVFPGQCQWLWALFINHDIRAPRDLIWLPSAPYRFLAHRHDTLTHSNPFALGFGLCLFSLFERWQGKECFCSLCVFTDLILSHFLSVVVLLIAVGIEECRWKDRTSAVNF